MKNQECDGTPALPLLVWGPCRRVSGRAQSFFGAFSPRGLLQQHVQQSQCSETDPTPGRPCGECPTSIRSLGWDIGIRGQPGHFTTSNLSRRQFISHFLLSLKTILPAPTWLNGVSQTVMVVVLVLWWWGHFWPHLEARLLSPLHPPTPPPVALLCPSLSLPTPEHAGAFLSPSPGRTNSLIQGHSARSVSLRQSCEQLCVKNGLRLPSKRAGLVGANCRGFVSACLLSQRR